MIWRKSLVIFVGSFCLFGAGYGIDFREADYYFANRGKVGEERFHMEQAQIAYKKILRQDGLNNSDKVRAITQLARLAIFKGDKFHGKESPEDIEQRRKIFKECWDGFMKELNPTSKSGSERGDKVYGKATPFPVETPNFFYYSATCLGLYGEVSGTAENLINIPYLNWLIAKGLKQDLRFQGGGILRILAGIRASKKAQRLGMYDPGESLVLINKAINTPPYPGTSLRGTDYCENYIRKALTLRELSKKSEAKTLIRETIELINEWEDFDELPEGLEPETKACRQDLGEILDTL